MYSLNSLSGYWLRVSLWIRVCLLLCWLLLCIILFLSALGSPLEAILLALVMALTAWIFKWSGVLSCIGVVLVSLVAVNALPSSLFLWMSQFASHSFAQAVSISLEVCVVGLVRYGVDLLRAIRQEVQRLDTQRQEAIRILNHMRQSYEQEHRVNLLKDQFIININHELRTPLTAISGYLHLLKEHDAQLESAKRELLIERAMRGCEELTLMVNTILDACEVMREVKPARAEDLLLADVIEEALLNLDPRQLMEHPLHLEFSPDQRVCADRLYLRQILVNLLSNACKYSPVQAPITVLAELREQSSTGEKVLCLGVQDAGVGIPPTEIPLLFGKFMRLKRDLSGSIRGTGLGLYISRQLVEAMEGQIWVESSGKEGEGSCFYITLPATRCMVDQTEKDVQEVSRTLLQTIRPPL